ncbi:MAG: SBBP repeat-containing protein [Bryobacteraceae bacterium]
MARKNSALIFISFVTIFAVPGAMAANSNSTTKPAISDYARPLSFEPNRGQSDKQVDFLAHGTGYSLFLSHAEAVIVLQRGSAKPGSQVAGTTLRLRPVDANVSGKVEAFGQLLGKSNYFVGTVPERWHTDIPNYFKVRYGNVYPGVDMIYYGNQRQLEYDFVVSSGADPGSISLEFQGASKAQLDRAGNVVMHTAAGELRWHKPVAYQEVNGSRKLVACAYVRQAGQRLGFTLGAYDRAKPLIIDPVLEYSTYFGGSGNGSPGDLGTSVAVDAHGNAYVTGSAGSTDFPTKNAFQNEFKGSFENAFVAKFDATGNLVYSTYLGGSHGNPGGSRGLGIAVDVHGNALVTGYTFSFDFPTKNPFQATSKNLLEGFNAFVTKLCPAGNALVYSSYLGGNGLQTDPETGQVFSGGGDDGRAIAVDAHGSAYVTGASFSTDFPTKNAFQNPLIFGSLEAFVTKFDAAGRLVYSTYLGGRDGAAGSGIAVDRYGRAYVTGHTWSTDFPTKNAFQSTLKSQPGNCAFSANAFVTKFNAAGNALVYSTYLGGSVSDFAGGIAVNARGNAYVTGQTASPDFPLKNPFQGTLKTSAFPFGNAFVTKLAAAGNTLVYSTYLGGSSENQSVLDSHNGIAVDARGQAYVTGRTSSTNFPTKNAFQNGLKGGGDAFVTKLCPVGTLVYSSYLGGSSDDQGMGIAVDAHGNAYVTGSTGSPDFPTKNAFQPMLGGPFAVSNAFVTKIGAR